MENILLTFDVQHIYYSFKQMGWLQALSRKRVAIYLVVQLKQIFH